MNTNKTESLNNRPICAEFCPDPNDMTDHDSARKQFNRIDCCAKRYTHLCKHDQSSLPNEEGEDDNECYDVLSYIDE